MVVQQQEVIIWEEKNVSDIKVQVFPKICAWCKKDYGLSNVKGSSTICPSCYQKVLDNFLEKNN